LPGSMITNLKDLPTEGNLGLIPWADSYWPSYQSGIAFRWSSPHPESFQYQLYTMDQLRTMSANDTALLSPAEKFDIYVSRYDYPTVKSEWQRTSPQDAKWEGLCHGWSVASLQYLEPDAVVLKNPDGIDIPFASSDIKALISYFIAEYAEETAKTDFTGERCKFDLQEHPDKENVSACSDLNAGAFHVIITNMLGIAKLGFVGDRDSSVEVWNQPFFQFRSGLTGRSRPPSKGASPTAGSEVHIETKVAFTLEQTPHRNKIKNPRTGAKTYRYWLELDGEGNIVGGSYSSWERLDFVWMEMARVPFSGFFTPLQQIYQASTASSENRGSGNSASPQPLRGNPILVSTFVEPVDYFRSSVAGQNYTNDSTARWSINPIGTPTYIEIQFLEFATERYHDKVKIFEGKDGQGALVGVFHGGERPQSVIVRNSAALVVFITDSSITDTGFQIRYLAGYY